MTVCGAAATSPTGQETGCGPSRQADRKCRHGGGEAPLVHERPPFAPLSVPTCGELKEQHAADKPRLLLRKLSTMVGKGAVFLINTVTHGWSGRMTKAATLQLPPQLQKRDADDSSSLGIQTRP